MTDGEGGGGRAAALTRLPLLQAEHLLLPSGLSKLCCRNAVGKAESREHSRAGRSTQSERASSLVHGV